MNNQHEQCLIVRGVVGATPEACYGDLLNLVNSERQQQQLYSSTGGDKQQVWPGECFFTNSCCCTGQQLFSTPAGGNGQQMFQGRQQVGGLVTLVEAAVGDMATVDPLLMLVMQVAVAALVYFLIGQLTHWTILLLNPSYFHGK